MYKEHSIFNLPYDKNEIIFRYFKFEHFKDLIESSELYLSALSEMSDKHEGTIPERIVKVWYENALKEKGKDFANAMLKVWKPTERDKKENFISSWCLNNSESFAMWKIYTKNRDAIAIKTTISNLISAFNYDDVFTEYIGLIKYHNGTKYYHRGNSFDPILYKWDYYSFENEIRIVIYNPAERGWEELDKYPKGIRAKVNLEKLIDSIYLAPFAEEKHYNQVKTLLDTADLNKQIYESGIKDLIFQKET